MNRFLAIYLIVGVSFGAARSVTGCQVPLTAEDKKSIAHDGVLIAVCQQKGRDCKRVNPDGCWGVYDACMADAGFRDGGAP